MSKITIRKFFLLFVLLNFYNANSQEVAINEIMASNDNTIADEDGSYEDWIELYNYGATAVNLQGYGITDTPTEPYKWTFPNITIAPGEYMIIWASNKDRTDPALPLHTNFKISAGGESITLTNPEGNLVDESPAIALDADVSYARQPDGTGPYLYFFTATPGAANTGTGLSELLVPPVFSHESGLYSEAFSLSLSNNNPNATIVYTTDGSEPDLENLSGTVYGYKNSYKLEATDTEGPMLNDSYTSQTYTAPINIYDRSAEPDELANKNTRQYPLHVPPTPVRKAMVVKAKAFVDGVGSKTIAKTYFVWSGGNPFQLPVISLQIQENSLFDYNDGIYTSGVDFDTWRQNNPENNQWYRPDWNNYWRSGSDWEYPVNVEFFEPESMTSVMSINAGFRIHGNNSRTLGIKNLRLYARSEYDDVNVFEHNLFDQVIPGAPLPDNNEYKRLMLRGDGMGGPVSYDVVFNRVMQPMFNGVTRIKPAIHFINGEFWGLTAIRDRFDNRHYQLNFGLNEDNIIIVDCQGGNCEIDEGDDNDYQTYIAMRDFIIQNDMADDNQFAQADALLDMDSFIDHIVLEIYAANDSYERNFWRVRDVENDGYGDGKWRLSVQDFEASLKDNINWMEYYSSLTNAVNESIFGNLLANEGFRDDFINRFADLLNTAYITDRFNTVVNETFNEVTPYLAEDMNRFPREAFYQESERTALLNWGTNRPAIQRDQIKTHFSIPSTLDITLNVSDTDAGIVKMNTVNIEPATPGVPENPYPWTGIYFNNIPVTVKAMANPGYVFTHWSGDVSGTDPILTVTPTTDMEIQANFEIDAAAGQVVYFWLMDSDIPNDTPLQTLDATYEANGLDATIVYNSCLEGYPYTEGDPNWRKASMERRNQPTPVNYRPEANNNTAYSNGIMKGLQVKQPFKSGEMENIVELHIPTTNLQDIKLSLATNSDGAAETMMAEHWDGTIWTSTGLENAFVALAADYELKEFDFSGVETANNNPGFMIRFRFDGADMFADEGKRVHFNNIAVTGTEFLYNAPQQKVTEIKVYPNPAENTLTVKASNIMDKLELFTLYGQTVLKQTPKANYHTLNIENLPAGMYILKVFTKNAEKTIKVIKK